MTGAPAAGRYGLRGDVEEHERRAAGFWALCTLLVGGFTAAASSHAEIMQPAGIAFFVASLVLNLGYAARIAFGPPRPPLEQLGAASLATGILGLQQYLVGELPLLPILLPLYVLAAVAVLEHAARLRYLPVVMATALSPLLYLHIDGRAVVVQTTLMLVVVIEMGLLGDFGDRLRRQRQQLAEAEALASDRAVTDDLTGLRNRRALVERISPTATGVEATVVYVDLDGFKPYNDRFGHTAGDGLLCRLGEALTAAAGEHGLAYRLGGDEFCVVLDGCWSAGDPLIAGIVDALTEEGPGYEVRCSYGVATTPGDAIDLAGALQLADQRMYLLKGLRRNARVRSDAGLAG